MGLAGASGVSLPTTCSSLSYHFRPRVQFVSNCRALKRSQRFLHPLRAMGSSPSSPKADVQEGDKMDYASISEEEWKKRLTAEQFYITRQKGTERAFTGCLKLGFLDNVWGIHPKHDKLGGNFRTEEYWKTKAQGTYHCICCDTPLYESSTKFDSGTGWPSYYQPIGNNVKSKLDMSIIFMPRQEVLCAVCGAHLGHVFDDGPPPTGKRHCINSASLKLKA